MVALVATALLALAAAAASSPAGAADGLLPPGPGPVCANGFGSGASFFTLPSGFHLVSARDVGVCATGRLTVTFSGSRVAGCASRGLCGYRGSETWRPALGEGDLSVVTIAGHGRRSTSAMLSLNGPVDAVVTRSGIRLPCHDRASAGGDLPLAVRGTRVRVGFGAGGEFGPLGTRCAGPLGVDVATALPRQSVPLGRLRHGRTRIDLTGVRHFAARGFAGTVSSTLELQLLRPMPSGGSSPAPAAPRERAAAVRYSIAQLTGHAVATVATGSMCGRLGACGVRAAITVAPRPIRDGALLLDATPPARRSRHELLAALRGGPSSIGVTGLGEADSGGRVTSVVRQSGTCRDATALRSISVELRKRGNRLLVSVSPAGSQAADPSRTRCPGPALGGHELASASLPLRILARRQFTVSLRGDSFASGPYRIRTRSTLRLTLRRTGRVTTHVY